MIATALIAASIYWHLPILVLVVSLVYSATRFDDWNRIFQYAGRGVLYILGFMGVVFIVLFFLSTLVPMMW